VRILLPLILVLAVVSSSCDRASVVHEGALPRVVRAADVALAADIRVVSARVAAGSTLASILRAERVVVSDVAAIVQRAGAVFDLRRVRKDHPYRLEQFADGSVRRLDYEIDGDRFLRVSRGDVDLVASVLPIPKTRHLAVVRGRIDRNTSSLVAAMDAAGETIDLTLALAEIFSGEIDFATEVQPGDRFELLVEKLYRDEGAFAGYGPILAAEFDNAGRRERAVRFTAEGASPAYFDEHGVSLRRFFLKSPLKFDPVVTSAFTTSRLHPVLHKVHAHLGVDYRAPVGAPVIAVADGTVVSAGRSGGAGNMVHLRHANGYETEYLHLSSIAVRAGGHVEQGDLIGRVGATGLVTGPHLDYRLKRNGTFVNPVTAHRAMPPADPIASSLMTAFMAARDGAFAALSRPAENVANSDATVQ
jgi:murein DD-endopeptidase MepM/ murein hydrolase activator NlpD